MNNSHEDHSQTEGGPYPAEAYHGLFPAADEGAGSIGETLRRARESQGFTLVDVANSLKIRRVYLDAIENGRLDELPTGPAYASGFIRSYAQALGLDPEPLLQRLPDEMAGDTLPLRRAPRPRPDSSTGRVPGLTLAATGLVLAAAASIFWLMSNGDSAARLAAERIPNRLTPPAVDAGETTERLDIGQLPEVAAAPTDAPVVAAPAPAEHAANPDMASEDPELPESEDMGAQLTVSDVPPLPPPRPVLDGAAANTAAPVTEPVQPEVEAPKENVLNPDEPAGRVSLYAVDSVWIQVKNAESEIYTRLLHKGDVWRVPDQAGLTVNVSTPRLLQLRLDGKSVGVAGPGDGFVTGIKLDPDSLHGVNP